MCSCVRDQDDYDYKFDPEALARLAAEYQNSINDLVGSGRYDDKEDFTVVVQPFLRQTTPPLNVRIAAGARCGYSTYMYCSNVLYIHLYITCTLVMYCTYTCILHILW